MLNFRYTTETSAAADAVQRVTDNDLKYLGENLKRKKENLDQIFVLSECDYDFHYKIVSISGNVISRLIFQSFKPIYSFFTEFFYSLQGAAETSLVLNLQLISALKERDREGAFQAMADILKYGEKKVYEAIDDNDELIEIRQR